MGNNSFFKSVFASGCLIGTYMRFAWQLLLGSFATLCVLFTFIIIYLITYEVIYREWIFPNLPQMDTLELMEETNTIDTLVVFKQGGEWGYLNRLNGKELPERYSYAWPFSEGIAAVIKNNRLMFINSSGEVEINTELGQMPEEAECIFIQGYCVVNSVEGMTGLIDKRGNWALPPVYDDIYHVNGLWKVRNNELYGLFSSSLDVIFELEHPKIDVGSKYIEVSYKNHVVKLYDYEKNLLEDFVINAIDNLSYRKINKEGEYKYDIADQMCYAVYVIDESEPFFGLMDRNGKRITPPDYTSIEAIQKDLYFCKPQGIVISGNGKRIE